MSAFCIPTPCIVPLRLPVFGKSKSIDTETKIEIMCDTELPGIEVFYTIDGTKPQPYAGIVQGSKTLKFSKPFNLPPGKMTVKAMAIHSLHHTIYSNVITKSFFVEDVKESPRKRKSVKMKKPEGKRSIITVETLPSEIPPESELPNKKDSCSDNDANDSDNILNKEVDTDVSIEEYDEDSINSNEEKSQDEINENVAEIDNSADGDNLNATFTVQDSDNLCTAEESVPEEKNEDEQVVPCEPLHSHAQCEISVQYCSSCNKVNSLLARYCDSCGAKLHKACQICKEHNPIVANYCQFCGEKFSLEPFSENSFVEEPKVSLKSKGIIVKPVTVNKGVLCAPACGSQSVQTDSLGDKVLKIFKKPSKEQLKPPDKSSKGVQTPESFDASKRKSPVSTPGRGYWRLQLDYICNHLKAYTNNNKDFQRSIGSPPLGRFISANVERDEENLVVNMSFEILPRSKKPNEV